MRMANESAQFPLDTGPLRCGSGSPSRLWFESATAQFGGQLGLTRGAGVNAEYFILKINRMLLLLLFRRFTSGLLRAESNC